MRKIRTRISTAVVLVFGSSSCADQPPGEEPSEPPWNVVLVTVDTYRSDHFLRGPVDVPCTPNIAKLAANSIVFEQASSAACVTSPGVAAIMSGLLPKRSGVTLNAHVLPRIATLASALDDAGYETAAFVGNPVLAHGNGFERGFDHYTARAVKRLENRALGETLTDSAIQWLDELPDDKEFFLWVHYMDPHGPYLPPEELLSLFPKTLFQAPEQAPLQPEGNNSGKGGIPWYQQQAFGTRTSDARDYLARYAAEVRHMDLKVGALFEELDRRELLDRSLVVFTSDHGEALVDDHGFYFSHGNGVTEDQVHVPLFLYFPGCDGGTTVDRPVSTVDILPTILDLLGRERLHETDGVSLLSEQRRYVVSQSAKGSSIREGSWKLLSSPGKTKLVNLSLETGPTADSGATYSTTMRTLKRKLEELEARPAIAETIKRSKASDETDRQLRELGYAGDDE